MLDGRHAADEVERRIRERKRMDVAVREVHTLRLRRQARQEL
jgi:hypothetical protein